MSEFVSNPLFGIALSILAYLVGMLIYRRFPHPLTTPLLLSAIFIIIFLKATGISYQDYYQGGVYLNNLIVPSTVALGIPLYKSFHLMKHHARSILFGSLLADYQREYSEHGASSSENSYKAESLEPRSMGQSNYSDKPHLGSNLDKKYPSP